MAKDKIGNLLKFTEFDKLQPKQKATKKTEVGGFAVLEKHMEGDKEGQLKFIEEHIKECSKKKIFKIYMIVEKCVMKKEKEEGKEKEKDGEKEE